MSLDRLIADKNGQTGWGSPEDQTHLKKQIKNNDLLIMGRKTYESLGDKIKPSLKKSRIILTKSQELLGMSAGLTTIKFTNESPKKVIENLRATDNSKILILGGNQIYRSFLKDDLVDAIYISIEPIRLEIGLKVTPELDRLSNFELKKTETINERGTIIKYYEKNQKSSRI